MTVSLQDKFEQINDHALPILLELLQEWFPLGRMISKTEFGVANLNGDAGESLSINIRTGKWKEFAGGPGGHDPLGLYAHAFCNGDRKRAFKELRVKFGLSDEAPPPKRKPHLKVVPKPEAGEWQPIVPPPDDVPGPNTSSYDHVFVYRDRDGRLLRYVVRNDARDGRDKWVRPLTYGIFQGKPGWRLLGPTPNKPKSLYGLERLDGRPALLQEGELKTDQVAKLLPGYACLSLTGGSSAIDHNDLTPLAGLAVVYSPDNDEPGNRAARQIIDKLVALGATVLLLDVSSHGFPEKWDLGNACSGVMVDDKTGEVLWQDTPWDAGRLEAFISENAKPYQPDAGPADFEPPEDDDAEWKEDRGRDERDLPPVALGFESGVYYYWSPRTKQIEPLARRSHTKNELIGIATLDYFRSLEQFKGEKGGLDWDAIGNFLKEACHQQGNYNPDRVRGRGAWLEDDGRPVLHLGDRLLMGNECLPLLLPGSQYVYEGARGLRYAQADPLGPEAASKLLEICNLFRWEKKISGTLMAGWLVVAPICGALFWRPSIWITGGSGSGKSTLEKLVMKPALGSIGLFLKGGTTEAGIRQKLGRDARPLAFDEAEAESPKAKGIIQGLLDLNRQSSSEGGAEIIKGTQSQTGAKTYHVRSCFAFSSINPMLEHLADENRVTVLELKNPKEPEPDAFSALVAFVTGTMTPEFCAGMLARSVALLPIILKNAETFSRAVAVHLGSSRVGDQIGTLLAGAYALQKNGEVSFETALAWVKAQDWEDTTSADATPDEKRLLDHLMQQRVTLDHGTRKEDLTLAEVVRAAAGENGPTVAEFANNELKRHGLWYDDGGVWIANRHSALKKHLEGTQWASGWDRALKRLPGTQTLGRDAAAIRFKREEGKKGSERQRATFVPMDLIE